MDAATASDSVTYKPEVGEVAGSIPTSRSVLFLLFILLSLFFFIFVCLNKLDRYATLYELVKLTR